MTIRLILNSSSMVPGYPQFLGHAVPYIRELFSGCSTIGFVPHARADHEGYTRKVRERFATMGLQVLQIKHHTQIDECDGIFVGGGNTFLLARDLNMLRIMDTIRDAVFNGIPYLGSSAGTVVACPTLCTTNDMPIVSPGPFDTLRLIRFQINPHYLDDDAFKGHHGETRTERIREYHEHNETSVIGLREGTLLKVTDDEIQLLGLKPARIFKRWFDPCEVEPGTILKL